jgi:hypothetical protein
LIRSPVEEYAHHPVQNDSSVSWCRPMRAAPGRHGGTRSRSSPYFRALAMGKRTAAPIRSRIPSFHTCAGYGLVFLPCGGLQSRQGSRVHRGLLRAKEPSLPLRDEVRSLRKARGKQSLSLRMTKSGKAPPSQRPVAIAVADTVWTHSQGVYPLRSSALRSLGAYANIFAI